MRRSGPRIAARDVSARRPHLLGPGGADERHIVPGQPGQGLGQFLEPTVVGEPAVPDRRVGPEDQLQPAVLRSGCRPLRWQRRVEFQRRRFRGGRRAGEYPVAQGLLPDGLEIAGERLPLPVVADDLQAGSVRLAQEHREHLVRRPPLVQGGDQRLLDRGRPVERPDVAPGLEEVRLRDVPVAELRGLVLVQAEVDPQADLVARERGREVEVGGGIIGRVRPPGSAAFDDTAIDVTRQVGQRADPIGRAPVSRGVQRRPSRRGSPATIDRVHQRVDRRRLHVAGHDQALAAMVFQVAYQGRDPRSVPGEPAGSSVRHALDLQRPARSPLRTVRHPAPARRGDDRPSRR